MRWMGGIMEDAIDRQLILVGGFNGDISACVAVALKPGEIAARNLQTDAMTGQKNIRGGPQI